MDEKNKEIGNQMATVCFVIGIGCGYIALKIIAVLKGIESAQLDLLFLCGLLGSESYRFKVNFNRRSVFKNVGYGIFIVALFILLIANLQSFVIF